MSTASPGSPPTMAPELPKEGGGRVLVLAIILGIAGAVAASAFLALITAGQNLLWKELPKQLNLNGNPLWYVLACVLVGTVLVALAFRLPGHTGGSPITGLHFNITSGEIASVALAAFGTLVFALPLGPEAPLIACGTAVGAVVTRRGGPKAQQLGMLLGGAAGIGAILGNPFVTAFLFLEFAAVGVLPSVALVPILISLGTGYLVMTGLGEFTGLGTHQLAVPGLAPVARLTPANFLWGIVVAVVAGIVLLIARELAWRCAVAAQRVRLGVLFGSAVAIAVIAVLAANWSGLPLDTVLFSGEEGLPNIVGATSAGAVIIVTIARVLTYGLALGSGFRGGPIFPAMAIGVGIGSIMAILLSDPSQQSPLVVVGVAATMAASLRLPFSSGLIALLVAGGAGVIAAPMAILGAIVGWLLREVWERYIPPPQIPAPSHKDEAAAGGGDSKQ